jgi:hypothetical protein
MIQSGALPASGLSALKAPVASSSLGNTGAFLFGGELARVQRYNVEGKARIDRLPPRADDLVCHARFDTSAWAALQRVARATLKARARRMAQRVAVLCTLEAHSLVYRSR